MVVIFLIFWGLFVLFSIVAAPIYIPTSGAQGVPFFSTSSPTLVISCHLDNCNSKRCEVVSHCGFDLHFPEDWWCWAAFHVPVGHLYVFFGKISIQIFCLFFNRIVVVVVLLLGCMSSLYILDVNPLPATWFAKIFSHLAGCFFLLLIVFFAVQKLFSMK